MAYIGSIKLDGAGPFSILNIVIILVGIAVTAWILQQAEKKALAKIQT